MKDDTGGVQRRLEAGPAPAQQSLADVLFPMFGRVRPPSAGRFNRLPHRRDHGTPRRDLQQLLDRGLME
jgi:hypothetical protein